MRPWKRICCAIDFSDTSRRALEEAAYLAAAAQAELTLVHAYEPVVKEPIELAPGEVVSESELRLRLTGWAAEVGPLPKAPTVKVIVGVPAAELVRYAAAEGFDALVLGTHGRSGLEHLLMGSTAERVIRHAPCPVVVVRSS